MNPNPLPVSTVHVQHGLKMGKMANKLHSCASRCSDFVRYRVLRHKSGSSKQKLDVTSSLTCSSSKTSELWITRKRGSTRSRACGVLALECKKVAMLKGRFASPHSAKRQGPFEALCAGSEAFSTATGSGLRMVSTLGLTF